MALNRRRLMHPTSPDDPISSSHSPTPGQPPPPYHRHSRMVETIACWTMATGLKGSRLGRNRMSGIVILTLSFLYDRRVVTKGPDLSDMVSVKGLLFPDMPTEKFWFNGIV
ncbi:hypothetical protein HNY73_006700 [Argiope bruennichi]|uniref:Uncharacterized protein n=1 Tax=Argiope bruennichi TaxID=94029 RepID=A0A8T0FC11_ARGBR|nr:hypothetical protein HNY73_006700 [Argiope bruennichi]